MPTSPEEMAAAMLKNMREKTGKTLPQWLKIVRATELSKHGQIVKHLKTEHAVTHGYANLLAAKVLQDPDEKPSTDNELVDSQYAGPKDHLRPIYTAIVKMVETFGSDVSVSPKKNYVSLRRIKQFAIIQPSTKTRVDVGINLKDFDTTNRLEPPGSFKSMVSHKVCVTELSNVDSELKNWLKAAYANAGLRAGW